MSISSAIEAILFYKSEPVSLTYLADALSVNTDDVQKGIEELNAILHQRGIHLIVKDDMVGLYTASEFSSIIERLHREEIERELTPAVLETLTTVAYLGPIAKSEIDYIRGVNSGFILRNLLVRGLIERIPHPTDQRSFLYKPSFDLLAHLGVSSISELPEYETTIASIKKFKEENPEPTAA